MEDGAGKIFTKVYYGVICVFDSGSSDKSKWVYLFFMAVWYGVCSTTTKMGLYLSELFQSRILIFVNGYASEL